MLTLAVQAFSFLAIVKASKLSLPLQARQNPCDSQGDEVYSERACGDICLPDGQFCCGNVPASSFLYACPIGTVCNDYFINDSDYLVRCCEGSYNPPIGAIGSCQVVPPFPSKSYIPGTATAPITAPSSTACGAEANAEGYGYRACGDVCLDVEQICCGFIPGTNQAWSCAVGQACLTSGSANIAPGSCVDASGYIVSGTTFVASNTTVASSPPSTTTTSTMSSSTPTTSSSGLTTSTGSGSPVSSSILTTESTSSLMTITTTSTIFSPTQTTSSSSLVTSITGGSSASSSIVTSESASPSVTRTTTESSSSITNQSPISTTGTVSVSSSSAGTITTSSSSSPLFTGAAATYSPVEKGIIYGLGALFVGAAAGDLGLF